MQFNREEQVLKFWKDRAYFNESGIKEAIKRALGDFTSRTEIRVDKSHSLGVEEMFKKLENTPVDKEFFVSRFIEYFSAPFVNNQDQFNDWHQAQCQIFLKVFENDYKNLAYGKAQKIVNMTFKYAYCLKDLDRHNDEEFYRFCHLPLDSFTLEWIYRNCKDCKTNKGLVKSKIPSWSKISKKAGIKYYSYDDIAKSVFKRFGEFESMPSRLSGLTPFQAEFIIWRKMQLDLAAEALFLQLIKFDESDISEKERISEFKKFKDKPSSEKLQILMKRLSEIDIPE